VKGRGRGLVFVNQKKRQSERFHFIKYVQNKANAFLWAYLGPKLDACLPAFGTTAPIVRGEMYLVIIHRSLV
jgi:hypothetical protein